MSISSAAFAMVLSGTAMGAPSPMSPVLTPDKTWSLDLGLAHDRSTLLLDLDTTRTGQTTVAPAGWTPPFLTARRAFTPISELTLGSDGLGLRFRLLDRRDSALPLTATLGGALSVAFEPTNEPVPAPSATLQVGGEWSVGSGVAVRPYLQGQYKGAEAVYFSVTDLQTGASGSGAWTSTPALDGFLLEPRAHVAAAIDLPIDTGGPLVVPGVGIDLPFSTGPGTLDLTACSSCAVGIDSVATQSGPTVFFTLRFESSGRRRAAKEATGSDQ